MEMSLSLRRGQEYDRDKLLRKLVDMQYTRNDIALIRGTFRVRGDVLEYVAVDDEIITRLDFFGDQIENITRVNQITGELIEDMDEVMIFPAKHFITPEEKLRRAIASIEAELEERLAYFRANGKLLEAQRLEMRTRNDLEMLREFGYCNGIENYSRHLTGRAPGQTPFCLLDFFPEDWFVFVDESHVTLPQVHGMYQGDRSRKEVLVEFGFRLPSAIDNRPLTFVEFDKHVKQIAYVSATPGSYERNHSAQIVEQIIRPTGLVDPQVVVRPTKGQVDDLMEEIRLRAAAHERVLVTTLTKKMAEDLTDYLIEMDVRAKYLHSEIETLERIAILRDLRLGKFDCLVGINLLAGRVGLARSLARRHFGCRQRRLSALGNVARPNHWTSCAPRQRHGLDVRRQRDAVDGACDQRDRTAPHHAARVQCRAQYRSAKHSQVGERHSGRCNRRGGTEEQESPQGSAARRPRGDDSTNSRKR